MSRTPAVRTRLGRVERRAAIVDGAARAFASGGFSATSMAEIAAATGVSHLIVYRHFASKEALYEEVLTRALDELTAALAAEQAVGRYGPTPQTMLRVARADPAGFAVLWRHAAREPEFASFTDRARGLLLDASKTAMRPHVARTDLRWATRATVAYLVEAVLAWIEDGDERLDDRFVAATNAALRAGVKSWSRPS